MNSVDSMSSMSNFTPSIKSFPTGDLFKKSSASGNAIHQGVKAENNVIHLKQVRDLKKPADVTNKAEEDTSTEEELYQYPPQKDSSVGNSFQSLAVAVGSLNGKITKQQLIGYLQGLIVKSMQGDGNMDEVKFVRGILTQFDTIANGEDYITSLNGSDLGDTYGAKQEVPPISTMEMEA